MHWVKISDEQINKIIEFCKKSSFSISHDGQKKIIFCKKPDDPNTIKFRHSIYSHFYLEDFSLKPIEFQNQIIISIKSGIASMAFYENGYLRDHKVFRAYMVRKKQGKSQVKYLKTKGKSRAGSRVRLQETLEFFDNINERLQSYFQEHRVDLIAFGCSPTLFPYFFDSKIPSPFDKSDPRIFKIPVHIANATFENLEKAQRSISQSKVWRDEANASFLNQFLMSPDSGEVENPEEDW